MQVVLGRDAGAASKNRIEDVIWDSRRLVNGHALLTGISGAGKTHKLKQMVEELQKAGKARFHIFDVHGDINVTGASEVLFSEQTSFGLNPLRVNPDPHFGGVRKCIQSFIHTVNRASTTALGVKQESVLRNILLDVYAYKGFKVEDPATWKIDESRAHLISDGSDNRLYLDVPMAEKDQAKAFGTRWDPDKKSWWVTPDAYKGGITRWAPKTAGRTHPTLDDVLLYAQRLMKLSFLGSDQEAVTELEIHGKNAAAYQRRVIDAAKRGEKDWEDTPAKEALDRARAKAADSYVRYLEAVRTGNELESLIKYDSTDVLKSVVNRLEALKATGLFKPSPPPFDQNASVWTYKLNPLSQEEKKLFVMFRLQELFAKAVQRGQQSDIVEVLVLDEVHLYASDDDDNILSTLARESRKFGVAVFAANQNADLPEAFLSSMATKIVLGIDEMYWKQAVSKMRITEDLLAWIKPHKKIAVQMKEVGAIRNEWRYVLL